MGYLKVYGAKVFLLAAGGIGVSATGILFAVVSKRLIDLTDKKDVPAMVYFSVIMGIVFLTQIILANLMGFYEPKINLNLRNQMRSDTLSRLTRAQWPYLRELHSADTLTCLTSDVANCSKLITGTIPMVASMGARLLISFVVLSNYDAYLAPVILLAGGVILAGGKIFSPALKRRHTKVLEAEERMMKGFQEVLRNMLVVKTYGLEEDWVRKTGKLQDDYLDKTVEKNRFSVVASLFMTLGFGGGYIISFLWGAFSLARGRISFGMFIAFLQLASQIQSPIAAAAGAVPAMASSLASAKRILKYANLPPEEEGVFLTNRGKWGIALENVTFGYDKDRPVIRNLSLRVKPGEILGIGGFSGEGKTTLLSLILALEKPDSGSIYLFNEKNESIPVSPATRPFFSYVPQGNTLFSGSLEDNLKVASHALTEEGIREALKVACGLGFAPKDNPGGEGGGDYSQGQLQRISIARALVRNAPILLLDESTAALDRETEKRLFHNLSEYLEGKSCIFVSHRESAKEFCHRFVYMDALIDLKKDGLKKSLRGI